MACTSRLVGKSEIILRVEILARRPSSSTVTGRSPDQGGRSTVIQYLFEVKCRDPSLGALRRRPRSSVNWEAIAGDSFVRETATRRDGHELWVAICP